MRLRELLRAPFIHIRRWWDALYGCYHTLSPAERIVLIKLVSAFLRHVWSRSRDWL
jgi:hypothetical protein